MIQLFNVGAERMLGYTAAEVVDKITPAARPTPSQQESIDQILQAGWYLLALINEILDLAAIEAGRLSLSLEPVSLVEVMPECQAMVEPQAQKGGISMTFPPLDMPCFVRADRTRMKQVLINLLSNAIKYNREQGTVEVKCTGSSQGRVRISVKDTGAGLPPDKLAQLFQSFNRLGQEGSAEQGTGIGLVVTKRLVELMGGVIGGESTVGVGSEFWVELISAAAPRPAVDGAEPTTVPEPPPQVPGGARLRTLLYVEDNTVLALSANAVPRDIVKGLEAGFFRYLTKPLQVDEFMDSLDVALAQAEKGHAHPKRRGDDIHV